MLQSFVGDKLAYYRVAFPLMVASFDGVPLVWNTYPQGSDKPPAWHGPLRSRGQHTLPTVDVTLHDGSTYPYLALQQHTMEWLVEYHHAVEFHSWTPTGRDPSALRFARILLEAGNLPGGTTHDAMHDAAIATHEVLQNYRIASIPLLDGNAGVAIYIPFSDAPVYPDVRRWLHWLCNDAAQRYPSLFTTEPNSAGGSRIHLHVKGNAPGLFSALPYSLRGPHGDCAVAPISWDELASRPTNELTVSTEELLERIRLHGNLFAAQLAAIGDQHFAAMQRSQLEAEALTITNESTTLPHGHVITAAMDILSDGRSYTAEQLLAEAIARKLLPPSTSYRYVYNALVTLITRNVARDRKSPIVQNADRSFRLNEPLDDWPDVNLPPMPADDDDETAALIARLNKSAHGGDPLAWETTVCDAFAQLGFRATHVGGHMAPDGYIDAQLGPLGYRATLECKSGIGVVTRPDAVEAAKWSQQYGAEYATLVGSGFSQEVELHTELLTHKVSAWSVDDLTQALRQQITAFELRQCFEPGFAADALLDVIWERNHGARKRIAYVARTIAEEAWSLQATLATQHDPRNAPRLTIDAALLLVQETLARAGASRACSRDEIQRAFEYLTNPIVGAATWTDNDGEAIVITTPQQDAT